MFQKLERKKLYFPSLYASWGEYLRQTLKQKHREIKEIIKIISQKIKKGLGRIKQTQSFLR